MIWEHRHPREGNLHLLRDPQQEELGTALGWRLYSIFQRGDPELPGPDKGQGVWDPSNLRLMTYMADGAVVGRLVFISYLIRLDRGSETEIFDRWLCVWNVFEIVVFNSIGLKYA
jgi:hypothetical protein